MNKQAQREVSDRPAVGVLEVRERQAEENLRQDHEQFKQLVDNIREVFFILSLEPVRMTYISPAYDEIWGRPRQELYERPETWLEAVHLEDRERVGAFNAKGLQGAQGEIEYRVIRPEGSVRWINARTFPVRNSDGKVIKAVGIAEDITGRKQKEMALEEAHYRINVALAEAQQRTREHAKLAELLDILQCCQTTEEACRVAEGALPIAIPSRSGSLCLTSASRNVVEAVATWGEKPTSEKTFRPDDCWALRRGKIYQVKGSVSPLKCAHVTGSPAIGHLCVPLVAQGETLGVLYLEPLTSPDVSLLVSEDPMEALLRQGTAVGERISLALANLRLREILRSQSIRDPLTGLFNRRYMEETLERELRRAVRNDQPVALVMFDIDHFKRFNDTFGHQAGDTLLRALGDFLNQRTRGQDVMCRYGGEEFALILSGTGIDGACKRAELLREELKNLVVQHAGEVLGRITFSLGVAAFPGCASSSELLHAADQALYRAKAGGRDRVISG